MFIFAENFHLFNVMKQVLLLMALLWTTSGCEHEGKDYKEAERVATKWANAFFNFDFEEASHHVTEESKHWLSFAASNITEADVDIINSRDMPASVVITDVVTGNDTLGQAMVSVSNWVCLDSIGQQGRIMSQGDFVISLVKRGRKWKVRMEGLPRNEKQSRD